MLTSDLKGKNSNYIQEKHITVIKKSPLTPPRLEMYDRVNRFDPTTGLIKFGIEFTDPQFAAAYANGMIARLNEYIRHQAIDETQKNIKFLEEQIQKTSFLEPQSVLYGLIEEQTKNIMLANVKEEYAFEVIDPAVPPETRIKPQRRQIAMVGFILGLLKKIKLHYPICKRKLNY